MASTVLGTLPGALLGWAAAVVVVAAGAAWFRRLRAVRVPEDRTAFFVAFAAALALAVGAFVAGAGLLGGIPAALAAVGSLAFLGLRLQSTQADHPAAIAVGRPAPDFQVLDADGRDFALSSLAGHPVLLKFFRGHW